MPTVTVPQCLRDAGPAGKIIIIPKHLQRKRTGGLLADIAGATVGLVVDVSQTG